MSSETALSLVHVVRCTLPLFCAPGQWGRVRPHFDVAIAQPWLLLLLAVNVAATFGGRAATVRCCSSAPNLMVSQLVATIEKFAQLGLTAFLRVPPLPPLGFWAGSIVLAWGTARYIGASDAPGTAPASPALSKKKLL